MNVFQAAVNVLQADPNLGREVTFTAPPAAGITVRARLERRDPVADFPGFASTVRAPGWEAHLNQADLAAIPRAGVDTITDRGTVYTIRDVAEDAEGTEWICDLGG